MLTQGGAGRAAASGDQWSDPEPPEGEAEGGQPCPGGGLSGADGHEAGPCESNGAQAQVHPDSVCGTNESGLGRCPGPVGAPAPDLSPAPQASSPPRAGLWGFLW